MLQALEGANDSQLDNFSAREPLNLGGITTVEALLGQAFLHRGEPSGLAAELLALLPAQRLERVIVAAKDWDQRWSARPGQ